MLEREEKCYKKDLFCSPEFDEDQIQNLTATAKLKVSVSNHCSTKFLAAFLQVPLEKELLLLLCLLYCLAPGRSNRKLNTYRVLLTCEAARRARHHARRARHRNFLNFYTWPYRGLKCRTHRGYVFFKVHRWILLDRGLKYFPNY